MTSQRLARAVARRLRAGLRRAGFGARRELRATVASLRDELGELRADTAGRLAEHDREIITTRQQLEDSEATSRKLSNRVASAHSVLWRSAWTEMHPRASETLVTVVMPTRNRAQLVQRAIEAVLCQTHSNLELVIVDDGSEDHTAAVLRATCDSRLVVLHGGGGGAARARNLAIRHARGAILAFADDDNLMAPGWLAAVCGYLDQHPEAGAVYGAQVREPEGGGDPELFFESQFDRDALLQGPYIDLGAFAVRAGIDGVRFDEELAAVLDWDMIMRVSANTSIVAIPVISGAYTTSAPNRITDHPDKATAIAAVRRRAAAMAAGLSSPTPAHQR